MARHMTTPVALPAAVEEKMKAPTQALGPDARIAVPWQEVGDLIGVKRTTVWKLTRRLDDPLPTVVLFGRRLVVIEALHVWFKRQARLEGFDVDEYVRFG